MGEESNSILRGIVYFGLEEARNRALEEAARMVEASYDWKRRNERYLAETIRALKRTPESHLAEAKVAIGGIFALLPPPRSHAKRA